MRVHKLRDPRSQSPSQNPLRKQGTLSKHRFAKAALLIAKLPGPRQGSAIAAAALFPVSLGG